MRTSNPLTYSHAYMSHSVNSYESPLVPCTRGWLHWPLIHYLSHMITICLPAEDFRLKPPLLWSVPVPLALPVTIYASPNRNSHDSDWWRMSCVTSRILDYCVWNCVITVPMGCWKCMTGKCRTVICSPCCIYSVLCFPRWSPTLVFVLQDIVYSDD